MLLDLNVSESAVKFQIFQKFSELYRKFKSVQIYLSYTRTRLERSTNQNTLSKKCNYEGRYETTQKVRSFHFTQK